jgi:hypothetical protein
LAWIYGLPCILFKMIALIGMRNYPINESSYTQLIGKGKTKN